jgi:hypothetical protein
MSWSTVRLILRLLLSILVPLGADLAYVVFLHTVRPTLPEWFDFVALAAALIVGCSILLYNLPLHPAVKVIIAVPYMVTLSLVLIWFTFQCFGVLFNEWL